MTTITRIFGIDAGHRLVKHESKCRNVHGHRYTIHVVLTAPALDTVGRILDFGVVKARLGAWLDENWDHAFIAQVGDPLIAWLEANEQKLYVMDAPPTAENLAFHFAMVAKSLLASLCAVVKVIVWETPNCSAEYELAQ